MLTAISLLSFGMVSCDPTDDTTNNHTNPTDPTNPTNPTTGDWVDLGLPSGLLWAKCNIGATTPEGYGDYYAWGETRTKETYNWSTYCYATVDVDSNISTLTKYNTSEAYGEVDNNLMLEAADDAATVVLGTEARIPTKAEWQELIDNTTAVWTKVNGVYGRKFTAANGNSLFLPESGRYYNSWPYDVGTDGYYWSSSLNESFPDRAWGIYFHSDSYGVRDHSRFNGLSIRAVRTR